MKLKEVLNETYKTTLLDRGYAQRKYRVSKKKNEKWVEKKIKDAVDWVDYFGGVMPPLNDDIDEIVITTYID